MLNIFELDVLEKDLGIWRGCYFYPLGECQLNTLMELLEKQRRIRGLNSMSRHAQSLWRELEVEAKDFYESNVGVA